MIQYVEGVFGDVYLDWMDRAVRVSGKGSTIPQ